MCSEESGGEEHVKNDRAHFILGGDFAGGKPTWWELVHETKMLCNKNKSHNKERRIDIPYTDTTLLSPYSFRDDLF